MTDKDGLVADRSNARSTMSSHLWFSSSSADMGMRLRLVLRSMSPICPVRSSGQRGMQKGFWRKVPPTHRMSSGAQRSAHFARVKARDAGDRAHVKKENPAAWGERG